MKSSAPFALRPVFNIGWRHLIRHPWQSVLMILGITLGVAVVVAIDVANASARQGFDLSTAAVSGRATHQISGGPGGVDESIYADLRRSANLRRSDALGIAAPVISEYASSPQLGGGLLQIVGVDPFADAPFRDYLGGRTGTQNRQPVYNLTSFLTKPGAVLVSTDLAARYQLTDCLEKPGGCEISLDVLGITRTATITGLLQPADSLGRRALENLIITDIATAQELTGRFGRIDRIDLILPEADRSQIEQRIQDSLPGSLRLTPTSKQNDTIQQMTTAFRVNLTALSLLALVVGLFLIYNTMTFSVVQRRPLFGTLRCLGVSRKEIFVLVASEAIIVGVIGAMAGILLGSLLGQGAVRLVTRTINDLFFVLTVRGVQIPATSLIKGGLLGIFATVLTAAPPAWEAATIPPRAALSRSGLESKARKAITYAAISGTLMLASGVLVLLIPSRDLVVSFTATFAVIIGSALLAPLVTAAAMRLAAPPLGMLLGSLGRMAPRNVVSSLSRTSIAVAALMVAVSVTIGVSLMVTSFRYTVEAWLEQTLLGDIYVSAPTLTATQSSAPIQPETLAAIFQWDSADQVYILRSVDVDSPAGRVHIAASSDAAVSDHRSFLATSVPKEDVKNEMSRGAVIVSEPFANRLGIQKPGGTITLFTDKGIREFPIAGIYYDYASTQGTILMSLETYRQFWEDQEITAAAMLLKPGVDADQTVQELRSALADRQQLVIRANLTLRKDVMEVFDRTFAITGALQLLATVVAFIGVLSALLSVELERQREMGILRAIGLSTRQMWGMILLETGLIGGTAGLLALPTGYVLALILVYIINRRSFGWTLQMEIIAAPFILAVIVSVGAALLAGIYPARRMSRMIAAEAIRYE